MVGCMRSTMVAVSFWFSPGMVVPVSDLMKSGSESVIFPVLPLPVLVTLRLMSRPAVFTTVVFRLRNSGTRLPVARRA